MRLTYYGHAAVLLETGDLRVIFDPYRWPDVGGYAAIDEPADVVVCSHENDRYHSHLGQIRGPFDVVRALEIGTDGVEVRGVRFQAVTVFETPQRRPGDEVAIVHLRVEGLHLVHLGDLGHLLSETELAPIRGADVVLVPAGGTPTIALAEAEALLRQLRPRVVIPVHYKVPGLSLPIRPVREFLEAVAALGWPVIEPGGPAIELTPATLPPEPTIVRLQPGRQLAEADHTPPSQPAA
ncbi:MAG: MBL fold metallo-hydrolase [Isosphaeraceae bacterium]|jgi:L-ascorbate metabolism protein UlaG (beta-lactamase superfamily)|nr:MAG: MBL fold metallo-hydrolase [Isosphaeraceae bacterium]